jgi:putative FmdB family regulatory protein
MISQESGVSVMPTYEYECTKCGHTFEVMQSIKDKSLSRCPECKGALRRLIFGGLGVIFKGSGYYSTDNKKGSSLTGGNGHKDKDKSSEKPAESKSESKTETKTDSAPAKEKAPAT